MLKLQFDSFRYLSPKSSLQVRNNPTAFANLDAKNEALKETTVENTAESALTNFRSVALGFALEKVQLASQQYLLYRAPLQKQLNACTLEYLNKQELKVIYPNLCAWQFIPFKAVNDRCCTFDRTDLIALYELNWQQLNLKKVMLLLSLIVALLDLAIIWDELWFLESYLQLDFSTIYYDKKKQVWYFCLLPMQINKHLTLWQKQTFKQANATVLNRKLTSTLTSLENSLESENKVAQRLVDFTQELETNLQLAYTNMVQGILNCLAKTQLNLPKQKKGFLSRSQVLKTDDLFATVDLQTLSHTFECDLSKTKLALLDLLKFFNAKVGK